MRDFFAGVVKLVDTLDLGSSAVRCGGSSPSTRTFFLSRNFFTEFYFMEITKKEIGNLISEITLQLDPSDYKPEFDKEIKSFRQKAHLKGFRKGKTPISAIKKMYGKSVLADILNKKISSEVDGYIKEQNLNLLGEPLPISDTLGII